MPLSLKNIPDASSRSYSPGPFAGDKTLPKLVCFDLDYTLWDLWIDTHVTAPLQRPKEGVLNRVDDAYGRRIQFYKEVPSILHLLQRCQIHIAAASRTYAPPLAREALAYLMVPPPEDSPHERPQRAIDFFESLEIYPGSKLTHFAELQKKTGIPYSNMLFFDDELRNAEVERLGVTFIHVPDGLNRKVFSDGLKTWRKKRGFGGEDEDENSTSSGSDA